ncbi:MAG: bifunctional pyr operon transcriptional regulator/uracil phosphoribosyltransferase PyrR [Spirochaetes bacterium]|nr:bifunctional pyr operon transcriptional regulator/uracil phosphoribosyltransferase PyrR [Spirochaetota bacterium]
MIAADSAKLNEIIEVLALSIADSLNDGEKTVLIGIQTRGVFIAERIQKILKKERGFNVPVGKIDVTLFRDDINYRSTLPRIRETSIGFDVDGKEIILIDDVLFTGRTVKAAIEDITSFGRPECIRLAVIVDRGHREMPFQADYAGLKIDTAKTDTVKVNMNEIDGNDFIEISE